MPKVALITGAAARIGQCLTETLHHQGFNIALHYRRSKQAAEALASKLNERRANSVQCFKADLSNVGEVQQLATEAQSAWNGVDVLINNASGFYPTDIVTATEAQWQDLIGSNLKGAFFLSQALVHTLSDRRGSIINIVDIHAERPLKEYSLYCIAKAGLAMMTKALAKELGPNIRVNGISPGAILWPDQDNESFSDKDGKKNTEKEKRIILEKIALKRPGQPDDIARTALFLIEQAPYITGQIIAVDGGRVLHS